MPERERERENERERERQGVGKEVRPAASGRKKGGQQATFGVGWVRVGL
jgi:hypothetical protein